MADIKQSNVLKAISILKQLNQKYYDEAQKKPLVNNESENPIMLQVTLKKIPPKEMKKFIRVRLPTPILTETSEVCLLLGDLDKRNTKAEVEPDVEHFKEVLKKEGISQVNEVITLRQLRKEYKPYEARRQLCGAYDVFLCDKKIAGVLPTTLGKNFFQKRKLPIQINMSSTNLKEQIVNALSSTIFHIACRGNSCASEVANLSMTDESILSNIMSCIDVLNEQLPGQWDNVLGLYIKTPKSKAIPLYMSDDDSNVRFGKRGMKPKAVTSELSTLPNSKVEVYRDGKVVIRRLRKDSSESDNDTEESNAEGEEKNIKNEITEENNSDAEKLEKKNKKRKSSLKLDEDCITVEVTEEKVESSKRRKRQKKKRKSNFELCEDNTKIEVNEEDLVNSKTEKVDTKKKSKKRKSNFEFNEENIDIGVKDEKIKNADVVNIEKKSKNEKSDLFSKKENIKSLSLKIKSKHKKQ